MAKRGHFALVLHSHIPFVIGHGTWPFGSEWVYEAAAEVYLPMLAIFRNLLGEGISPRVTVSFTPILMEQLASPEFKQGFDCYLALKRDFASDNRREFGARGDDHLAALAEGWETFFERSRVAFLEDYGEDILAAFRQLQDDGHLEVMTSAATHGFLPLLGTDSSIQAQLRLGVATYQRHFGRAPRGMWLPECAYRPGGPWAPATSYSSPRWRAGLETAIAAAGLEYFIVDSHLLENGKPIEAYIERFESVDHLWRDVARRAGVEDVEAPDAVYHAYAIRDDDDRSSGVDCFVRDPRTAVQVWSARGGYPGDPSFLDFHKKHEPGGLRYWRITDAALDIGQKEPYHPEAVDDRLSNQSLHFVSLLRQALVEAPGEAPRILVAPFDTELFGHWWFEGVRWIEHLLRRLAHEPDLEAITLADYHQRFPAVMSVKLAEGSWGEGGGNALWLNPETLWTWGRIHEAELTFSKLRRWFRDADTPLQGLDRLMRQLGRELLLMQSSDWQFLISNRTAHDYAQQRLANHAANFERLAEVAGAALDGVAPQQADLSFLAELEALNNPFPDLDLAHWD